MEQQMKYGRFQVMRLIYASLVTAIIASIAIYRIDDGDFKLGFKPVPPLGVVLDQGPAKAPNPFDRFDDPPSSRAPNPYDQFDEKPLAAPAQTGAATTVNYVPDYYYILGRGAPAVIGGAFFYWWLGRAKWFKRKFVEEPDPSMQQAAAPSVVEHAPPCLDQTKAMASRGSWTWPTVRAAAIFASMVAVASFFLMSDYHVQWSFIVNVMKGHIFGDLPYRWMLAGLAAFVGIVALKHRR